METLHRRWMRAGTIGISAFASLFLSVCIHAQTVTSNKVLTTPPTIKVQPPSPPPAGPWKTQPALNAKLGKSVDSDGFDINPPSGFGSVERDSPDGAGSVYDWTQPPRDKGSQPSFYFIVTFAPKGDEKKYGAGDILVAFIDSIRGSQFQWSQSPTQKDKIGNVDFQRIYYAVVDDAKGYTRQGFIYVAEPTTGEFIIMRGEDAEPYAETDLPILENAALSIRPKGEPAPPGAPK